MLFMLRRKFPVFRDEPFFAPVRRGVSASVHITTVCSPPLPTRMHRTSTGAAVERFLTRGLRAQHPRSSALVCVLEQHLLTDPPRTLQVAAPLS